MTGKRKIEDVDAGTEKKKAAAMKIEAEARAIDRKSEAEAKAIDRKSETETQIKLEEIKIKRIKAEAEADKIKADAEKTRMQAKTLHSEELRKLLNLIPQLESRVAKNCEQ